MADRLAKADDPDSAVGPNDLPVAYIKLGDVLMAQGNLARTHIISEGFGRYRELGQSRP